jgi:hypothetical protein
MGPLKKVQFRSSLRKAKILTTGIHRVFRGLKFEPDAEIGRKVTLCKGLSIAVALMLVPFAAMATMTAISDSEMEAVTGQAGITLAPIDVSLDLNIKNIAYTDPDTGILNIAGIAHSHIGGTFNIHDFQIVNLHETLNGTPIYNSVASDAGPATFVGIQAKAIEFDIVSFGDGSGGSVPLMELRNRTAIVVSGPDLRMTIDEIKLNMTLDYQPEQVSVEWAHNKDLYESLLGITDADGYEYTSTPVNTQSFGNVTIQGVEVILYAYPRVAMDAAGNIGAAAVGAVTYKEYIENLDDLTAAQNAGLTRPNGDPLEIGDPFNMGNRAQIIISPH